MKKHIGLVIALVAIAGTSVLAGTQSSHPKAVTTKASKSRGSSGSDPNIKVANPVNVPGKPAANHSNKGTHRGALSNYLHINNQTGWYVSIYLDGTSIGTVAPYGDSYGWEPAGSHTLYASAPGTTYTWGPASAWFNEGASFTWTLTQ